MKRAAFSTKEKLILNELIHKHQLNDQWSEKKVRQLHEDLLGTLSGKWERQYIVAQKQKLDFNALVFSLLILPLAYPLLKVSDARIKMPSSFYWKTRLSPFLAPLEQCLPSVGRLLGTNKKGRIVPIASGFQIGREYFISVGIAEQSTKRRATTYWVDFSDSKKLAPKEDHFKVKQIISGKTQRWMLFKMHRSSSSGRRLPGALGIAKITLKAAFLMMIGYPQKIEQQRNNLLEQYGIFGPPRQLGNKSVSLGHLYRKGKKWKHDCSATQGSEGSPIFHPESGKVIGLHYKSKKNNISYMINLAEEKELLKALR
ncbi:MAG: hypothetical protein AAF985_00395 [Bacteroidota bacterium]